LKHEWTAAMRFGVMGVCEVITQCGLKVIGCTAHWRTGLLAAYTDKKQMIKCTLHSAHLAKCLILHIILRPVAESRDMSVTIVIWL